MSVGLFTHPDCTRHMLAGHPERPERLVAVMERLRHSGLAGAMEQHLSEPVQGDELKLVHAAAYVEDIFAWSPVEETLRIDPDTYMSPGTLRAARLAAGACVQATQAILSGPMERAFCAVRPPGHHAELASAMGFCIFNSIALAAETALADERVERVAILDFDVHHCNGTVDIFKDRPEVLVCSSFQDNYFPHRYLDYRNEHIIGTPLVPGTPGREFQRSIEAEWFPVVASFRSDFIFVSAGFDAHEQDPLGELNLLEYDYRWITRHIVRLANEFSEGRIVSTLEGGYDLGALASCVEAHVEELL